MRRSVVIGNFIYNVGQEHKHVNINVDITGDEHTTYIGSNGRRARNQSQRVSAHNLTKRRHMSRDGLRENNAAIMSIVLQPLSPCRQRCRGCEGNWNLFEETSVA